MRLNNTLRDLRWAAMSCICAAAFASNAAADIPAQIATVTVATANHLQITSYPGDVTRAWQNSVGQSAKPASFIGGNFSGGMASDVACIDFDADDDPHVILTQSPGRTGSPTIPWVNRLRSPDQLSFYFVPGDFNGDGKSDVMSFYVQKNGNNTDVYAKATYGPTGATSTADPQDWAFPNERESAFISGFFRGPTATNDAISDIAAISNGGVGIFTAKFFVGPAGSYATGADWTIAGVSGAEPVAFRAADFNGDGFADIAGVFYNSSTGQYTANVVLGPDGAVTRAWNLGTQLLVAVLAGDFDGDGYADLAAIRESATQRFAKIALGSSSGNSTQTVNWTLTNTSETSGPYLAGTFAQSKITGTITLGVDHSPFQGVLVDAGAVGQTTTAADGSFTIDGFIDGMTFNLVPSTSAVGPHGLHYHFQPVSRTGVITADRVETFVGWENIDTDGDGIFDDLDSDDDNDGLSDQMEAEIGTDPLKADTDGDGVNDGQEISDGTDPLDKGSNRKPLAVELCSEWNGYLNMWNIKEHVNRSQTTLNIMTTLYNQGGVPQSTRSFSLPPGRHFDLLVHEMPGWHQNEYGKVCSRLLNGAPGDLDGRMVYYKENQKFSNPENERFEFAFALKFANGLKGRQYVGYNTFQPSGDPKEQTFLAANWIQINNLEPTQQAGTLIFYGEGGPILSSQNIVLDANARIDVGAHNIGRSIVGLAAWVPDDANAEFLMRNSRYFYDNPDASADHFLTAFDFDGTTGNGREVVVPIDTRATEAVVEISNTLPTDSLAQIQIYTADGARRYSEVFNLSPHSTRHFIANSYIDNQEGIATVQGGTPESLITTSMQYGRTEKLSLTYLYGVPGSEPLMVASQGSYNTYLNQGCSLILMNQAYTPTDASISMTDGDTLQPILSGEQIHVPARGMVDFNLCGRAPADSFGTVTVQTGSAGLATLVLRKGNRDDYRFPTPLR